MPLAPWRAVYYPYLEITDTIWLKTAALYYDQLDRIVPEGYKPKDHRTARALIEHFEFIKDVDPKSIAMDIMPDFRAFIIRNLKVKKAREEILEKLENKFDFEKTLSIRVGKVGPNLIEELQRLGFHVTLNQTKTEYEFDQVTGSLYMAFLANHMAGRFQSSVVTNDLLFQLLIRHIQRPDKDDQAFRFASVIIPAAVPEPLRDIPIRKIIRFRKYHNSERRNFYHQMNRLVSDLNGAESQEALDDILRHRHKDIDAAANELRKSLRGVKIDTGSGMISLSAPGALSALGAAAGTGGVIALAGAKGFNYVKDYHKAKAGSPAAYVLSLQKLQSSSLLEDLIKGKLLL